MKRLLIVSLAATVLLASCSIKIDSTDKPSNREVDPSAIGFGVYMKRGVTTKAGYAGELTTDTLKKATVGFGVFGYYGNGAMYNETMKPDFMYNQWVKFTENNVWEYSPIKYWPNEFGQAAGSEVADRLTFFAYAPYVEVTPSTGIVTGDDEDGILGMTRNISAGDPQVMYGARLQPGGGVDLCWGVAASDFTSSVDGNNNKVDKGKPFINLIKPKTGDKISFEFNHSLTQLNVQIDADIDVESHADSSLDSLTRIYVRSVTFTGFTTRGSLNLNSVAGNPAWSDISGTGRLRRDPVTVYDGRSDGLEGLVTAKDINETPATLSPKVIQTSPFSVQNKDGVTNEAVNLFSYADPNSPVADVNAPVMVIPIAGVPVTVTIVYDVETADPNLAGYLSDGVTHGVSVENKITKTVQMSGQNMTLEPGKRYVIGLHLGMTSVKFDAQVAEWDDTQHKGTADLPENATSLGDITIADEHGTELTAPTVWSNGTMSTPTVTVLDALGNDITDDCEIEWSSTVEDVATVGETTGVVTIVGPGTTVIKAKVTHGDQTGSKSYTLNVNQVTGITVAAESSNIVIGGSTAVNATLEINGGSGIKGTLTDLPAVTWTSGYDKVTVVAASGDPSVIGSTVVANATATAAADAEASHTAVISAKVGTPYASEEKSATATLTCVAKIAISSVSLSATELTTWIGQGAKASTVTSVKGTDGSELKDSELLSISWSSDKETVATVDSETGEITLHDAGVATITAKATLKATETTEGGSKSADYTVSVNKVSGITVTSDTDKIYIGGSLPVTATVEFNDGNPINGTVTTPPTVCWSPSQDNKVKVTPESGDIAADGTASTTAETVSGAVADDQATITARVGVPYATTDLSSTVTLTCIDKITIQSVAFVGASSTTVWKHDGATVPTDITVTGSDGNPLTTGVSFSWAVKEGASTTVLDVTGEGVISLKSSGTTTLTVTASILDSETTKASSGTADYVVNVNEVTGISVDPTSATVLQGGTVTLTATLTKTGFGDVTSLSAPTITWESGTTSYVTISSTTGQSTVATGVATGGSSMITATVDPAYMESGATGRASATVTCSNATTTSATGTGFSGGWN